MVQLAPFLTILLFGLFGEALGINVNPRGYADGLLWVTNGRQIDALDPNTGETFPAFHFDLAAQFPSRNYTAYALAADHTNRVLYILVRDNTTAVPLISLIKYGIINGDVSPIVTNITWVPQNFNTVTMSYSSQGLIVGTDNSDTLIISADDGPQTYGGFVTGGFLQITSYDSNSVTYISAYNTSRSELTVYSLYNGIPLITLGPLNNFTSVFMCAYLPAWQFFTVLSRNESSSNSKISGIYLNGTSFPTLYIYINVNNTFDNRGIAFMNPGNNSYSASVWIGSPQDYLIQYLIKGENPSTSPGTRGQYYPGVVDLTYMAPADPFVPDIDPDTPTTTSALFGPTPQFSLTLTANNVNPKLTKSETTTPQFGDFATTAMNYANPIAWQRNQFFYRGLNFTSLDNLQVTASTTEDVSYSYTWASTINNTMEVQYSTLYSPTSQLSTRSGAGLQYSLDAGAVKFSLALSNIQAHVFNGDTSAVMKWSACFTNDETFGLFDTDHYTTKNTATYAQYTFHRSRAALQLTIPTQAVADGKVVTISHAVSSVDRTAAGVLNICVDWEFPYFNSTLLYDPDLAVLVSNDGDGVDETLIIEIVIPTVVGGAAVIVCCVIFVAIVMIVLSRHRLRKSLERDYAVQIE